MSGDWFQLYVIHTFLTSNSRLNTTLRKKGDAKYFFFFLQSLYKDYQTSKKYLSTQGVKRSCPRHST